MFCRVLQKVVLLVLRRDFFSSWSIERRVLLTTVFKCARNTSKQKFWFVFFTKPGKRTAPIISNSSTMFLYLGKWVRDLDKKGQFTFSKGPAITAWLKTNLAAQSPIPESNQKKSQNIPDWTGQQSEKNKGKSQENRGRKKIERGEDETYFIRLRTGSGVGEE